MSDFNQNKTLPGYPNFDKFSEMSAEACQMEAKKGIAVITVMVKINAKTFGTL